MELRATMELRVGIGSQHEEEDTPYIAKEEKPTVIHIPARDQRYYRSRTAVLPLGRYYHPSSAVLPLEAPASRMLT